MILYVGSGAMPKMRPFLKDVECTGEETVGEIWQMIKKDGSFSKLTLINNPDLKVNDICKNGILRMNLKGCSYRDN